MRRQSPLILVILTLALFSSCKTTTPGGSDLSASGRKAFTPDKDMEGLTFNFCPKDASFSALNGMWLSYLAIEQYTHFGILGPALERLGFGEKGEGESYRKAWFALRWKRVNEGLKDTDDTWKDEASRLGRLKLVEGDYQSLYSEAYKDDGLSSTDLERKLVSAEGSGKIRFLSGGTVSNGTFVKSTTQVLYAEHPKLDFSVISFRGTELDETADLFSDINIVFQPLPGMGSVHLGFYNAYMEVEEGILAILKSRSETKKAKLNLYITGHSLGGALATLFSARIAALQAEGQLSGVRLFATYTLGSPRVGNNEFADKLDAINQQEGIGQYRIRNHRDTITATPISFGYASSYWHAGSLVYIDSNGDTHAGDGYETIEKKTDYPSAYPLDMRDHMTAPYFLAMRKLYEANLAKNPNVCASERGNKPLAPFYENPRSRGNQ